MSDGRCSECERIGAPCADHLLNEPIDEALLEQSIRATGKPGLKSDGWTIADHYNRAARAASQERPQPDAIIERIAAIRADAEKRSSGHPTAVNWQVFDLLWLLDTAASLAAVYELRYRQAEARAASQERPKPDNPRDTPHLDRNGDRWREHPSEARLAETDAGPRSESRSVASGGWQGGPSGDIQRAIAIIEDSRQTHVNWAEWRRKGNGTDTDHEMIGDLEWHEAAIRDYDHVLAVLLASQERPHDNHDGCNPYDPAHIAGKAPASQERPSIDVERLAALLRDHCHDSIDEGLPILLRHKHLAPFVRDDCAAAIARGLSGPVVVG